jgi:hypothetical protein
MSLSKSLSFQIILPPCQLEPDLRRHPRIVQGAVVLPEEGRIREQVQIDRLQCVVGQAWEAQVAHLQCADVAMGKAHFQPGELIAQEGDLEGGVMGDEDAAGDEVIKPWEDLLGFGLAFEHLVGDPVDRRTVRGIGTPASISVVNSSTMAPRSTATAPISMIRWPCLGESPVISRSTTTCRPRGFGGFSMGMGLIRER